MAFPPCPLESPDHSCEIASVLIVHQQHLLPQPPPSVLGSYSRNFLHHILLPRKGMHAVSASQWAHSAYQLMLGSLQLFHSYISAIWSLGRAHGATKPGVSLCWRAVSSHRQADCLGQLVPLCALLRRAAWVLTSASSAPAQKGPQTLLDAPQGHKVFLGIVLSMAAQDF